MKHKVKVVYIVGSSRCGSTIFDTVLGNHSSVESVGELVNAPKAWADENEHCACGELVNLCNFWSEVRGEWAKLTPELPHGEGWHAVQEKFERLRRLGRVMSNARKDSDDFKRYAYGVTELYRALQRVSGKPVILDSSKNPVRALALSYCNDIDLRLVHLIRDGRGVAWSLRKSYRKDAAKGVQRDFPGRPVARSAASWVLANTLAETATKRSAYARRCRFRYEDFVSEPRATLHAVGELCGLDFQELNDKLQEARELWVGHTVAGNRVRMAEKVQLQPDIEWRSKLSRSEKRIFWVIAGRMAQRYGYERSA